MCHCMCVCVTVCVDVSPRDLSVASPAPSITVTILDLVTCVTILWRAHPYNQSDIHLSSIIYIKFWNLSLGLNKHKLCIRVYLSLTPSKLLPDEISSKSVVICHMVENWEDFHFCILVGFSPCLTNERRNKCVVSTK